MSYFVCRGLYTRVAIDFYTHVHRRELESDSYWTTKSSFATQFRHTMESVGQIGLLTLSLSLEFRIIAASLGSRESASRYWLDRAVPARPVVGPRRGLTGQGSGHAL